VPLLRVLLIGGCVPVIVIWRGPRSYPPGVQATGQWWPGTRRTTSQSARASAAARRVDITGGILVTFGLIGVSYGLIGGPVGGWARPSPLTSVIAGVLLLAAFIAWERRVRMPMLPLGLFGSAQDARAIRLPSSRSRPMVQIGTAPARSVIVTVMT